MSPKDDDTTPIPPEPASAPPAAGERSSSETPATKAPTPLPAATPAPTPTPVSASRPSFVGRLVKLVLFLGTTVGAGAYFYPNVVRTMTTVSTDDAFVNGHSTQVAPRIPETVVEVLVDDNDFVHAGDLLLRLDPTMWDLRVQQAKSALAVAEKSRDQAEAKARSIVSAVRASRFQLASAISTVENHAASLRVATARYNEAKAAEALAVKEAGRYAELAARNSVTQEQADIRRTEAEQAQARVRQALAEIHSARVGLELSKEPEAGRSLDDTPDDLSQKHSSVLAALGQLSLNLAELGAPTPAYYDSPDQFIADLKGRAPDGDVDALIEQTVLESPILTTAEAQVQIARDQLAEAELNRTYCEIRTAVDGFISNRNVNLGDRVAAGQRLMAVRSFQDVWIDCNFKETQLELIRIGQLVDVHVDAYPHKVFTGRVTGFSPGTGASMSLLPPQNATGNFVKIVQRLPVRVELVGGNPPDTPLFIGLSARPHVRILDPPLGPNAGQRLRGDFPSVPIPASWRDRLQSKESEPSAPKESSESPAL